MADSDVTGSNPVRMYEIALSSDAPIAWGWNGVAHIYRLLSYNNEIIIPSNNSLKIGIRLA